MRARELAEDLPTSGLDDDALNAAMLIGRQRLPGIAVLDEDGRPVAVLPASQVLRFLVPVYVQEDPSLARVLDEGTADQCVHQLASRRVRDLLPPRGSRVELAAVRGDATVIECAATMARLHSPVLVVMDDGHVHGLLTASHLLDIMLPAPDPANPQ